MSTVTLRHPSLPPEQEIEVPKDAMPHYTAAGWQLVPSEELEQRAARKAQAAAEAAAAEEAAQGEAEGRQEEDQPESQDSSGADEPDSSEPAELTTTKRPARRARAAQTKDEEN